MATATAQIGTITEQVDPPNPDPQPDGGGGGGGGGPPAPGGGAVPNPGPNPAAQFALTPALMTNNVLDYSQTDHIKLYYRSVEPLEPEFDVEPATLKLFLANLRKRAFSFNWMETFAMNKQGKDLNLIDDYGALTYDEVKAHVATYIGQNVRNAQNSMQIFNCLTGSLTEAGRARVYLESSTYTVNGTPDGVLFLKAILRLAHIDTRATVTVIRTRLSSLDTKMAEIQDNITEFNEFVKLQRSSLESRGEETLDLLVNLFKGFKAVADKRFVTYIESKEDHYNEGHDLSPDQLMELAEAKYKTLVENGTWKEPTEADKKIVALTAQLKNYQQAAKGNEDSTKYKKSKESGKKSNKDQKGNKGKGKTPWYYIAPKEGEKTKELKGKTYHWCPNHGNEGKWVIHKPSDCQASKNKSDKKKEAQPTSNGSLKVNSYAAALAIDDPLGEF